MSATVVADLDFDDPVRTCPVPEAVRSRRHLAALAHLRETRTATVGELADVVADESDAPAVDGQRAVETALVLHEAVLPELAAAGLVDYEPTGAAVTVGFLSAAVADWLDGAVGPVGETGAD